MKEKQFLIICHTGAGNYSTKNEGGYKKLAENACNAVLKSLENDSFSTNYLIKAVTSGIQFLENSANTNAGYGSNLTISGSVECEAGIMCGINKRFGGVGAVKRLKNPIDLASKLLELQIESPVLSLGRCPPNVLVSEGAEKFAHDQGIELIDNSALITSKRMKKYNVCMDLFKNNKTTKRHMDDEVQDTIGVILLEVGVGVVSATSSGGILLKYDGRLGQSCIFGAGCFADTDINSRFNIAAVSTGLGEQLVRTMLPLKTCEYLKHESKKGNDSDLNETFSKFIDNTFMESEYVIGDANKSFGIIALRQYMDPKIGNKPEKAFIDILYGHSTPALCFATYSSSSGLSSFVSRCKPGKKYMIGFLGENF